MDSGRGVLIKRELEMEGRKGGESYVERPLDGKVLRKGLG